jgi:PilZ domain
MLPLPVIWEEKRSRTRSQTQDRVEAMIIHEGKRLWGKVLNLSIGGALVHFDESIGATKNSRLELVFAQRLNNGKLIKVYFKHGTVIHVTGGNIGLVIGNRTNRL